jgi:SAM-dependent methyltransferase
MTRQFDAAVVIGGLHHCVVDLAAAIDNLAALLKPGGTLLMMEPSADSVLEGLRQRWYRHDRYFDAPTERALSHDELLRLARRRFRVEILQYIGGPKRWIAPWAFPLERAFNVLNAAPLAPVFVARWRRI